MKTFKIFFLLLFAWHMPHNQLLQIRKQKNNNQSIIFYITPKAKHCKGAKILSFLYRIPEFGSLAKDEPK